MVIPVSFFQAIYSNVNIFSFTSFFKCTLVNLEILYIVLHGEQFILSILALFCLFGNCCFHSVVCSQDPRIAACSICLCRLCFLASFGSFSQDFLHPLGNFKKVQCPKGSTVLQVVPPQ